MRKFLKILILTFLGAVTITSCSDDSDGIPGWPWNDNSTEKPDEPDVAEAKHDIFGLMRLLIFLTMPIVRKT